MKTGPAQRQQQAERLKMARIATGFTSAASAVDRFRWKQSTYLAHENGQNGLGAASAIEYGKAYHVEPGWLLTGVGRGLAAKEKPSRVVAHHDQEFTQIGRFDAGFSMGPGALVSEHPEPLGYWMIETQWLSGLTKASPDQLAIVRVDGDSMSPTFLAGDWVLIDRSQQRLSREGIYAIRVGDDAWVKRISLNLRQKMVRIISDNVAIPVQDIEADELSVIGRVISLVSRKIA